MPPSRIRILPPEVTDRIAAGEVVSRPASAVKELVENSLDAGARRITIEIEAGGKDLLRVTDDGCGMTGDEVLLAVQRHATSKLTTVEDLDAIRTLGFRGEALPSIASVSEFEILSCALGASTGTRLIVDAGRITRHEPAASPPGTRVTARALFKNLPVRRNFLRSDLAEAGQVADWVQRLALAHPAVTFRLTHNGREMLLCPGSEDALNSVVAVLGRTAAREMLRIPALPAAPSAVGVSGFISRPTFTRANRQLQYFYVNGRSVRSPIYFDALDQAYKSSMPSGRFPAAVVFLTLDPALVDVNVHPAKTEVRFVEEAVVRSALIDSFRRTLSSLGRTVDPPEPTRPAAPSPLTPTAAAALPFADAAIAGTAPVRRPVPPAREAQANSAAGRAEVGPGRRPELASPPVFTPAHRRPEPALPGLEAPDAPPARYPATPPERPASLDAPTAFPVPPVNPSPPAADSSPLELLGQAQNLFVLAADEEMLWVIDQHVAHERVLFDRMLGTGLVAEAAQRLLLPPVLRLPATQSLLLAEYREDLAFLGFIIEPFGVDTWRLTAAPLPLADQDGERLLRDLAENLADRIAAGGDRPAREDLAADAAGRSCKRAVKAGHRMHRTEMEALLAELLATAQPHTCPHGRPISYRLSRGEIERQFSIHPAI